MMSDLSQAEIDALLAGAGGDSSDDSSGGDAALDDGGNVDDILSPIEKDALGEIGNISMGSAATTLSARTQGKYYDAFGFRRADECHSTTLSFAVSCRRSRLYCRY